MRRAGIGRVLVLLAALVLAAAAGAGCGDDGDRGGQGIPGGDVSDTTGGGDAADDIFGQGDNGDEDGQLPDAGPDAVLPDGGGDTTDDGVTTDVPDGIETDTPDGGGPDTDTGGDDVDGGGLVTDIPIGQPCGPDIGTCVAGASCIEAAEGSDDMVCLGDVEAGGECGPGKGQCVAGTKCATPAAGGAKLCLVTKQVGEGCDGPGETCAAGAICALTDKKKGYQLLEVWTTTAAAGPLVDPSGVVASADKIIVSDTGNDRLAAFDLAGGPQGTLGSTGSELGQFIEPLGIAFIASSGYYVADSGNGRITRFNPISLAAEASFGSIGTENDQFGEAGPADVAFSQGPGTIMFVSDPGKNRVVRMTVAGQFALAFGDQGADPLSGPTGLFATDSGVYVADTGNARVQVFDPTGQFLLTYGGPAEAEGGLIGPTDVLVTAGGEMVLVADPAAGKVVAYDASGAALFQIGAAESGGPIEPWGIAMTGETLVVSDRASAALLAYTPAFAKVCITPKGVGEACTAQIPCAAGLSCLSQFPGSPSTVCKTLKKQGEVCGKANTECEPQLECVTGDALSGYKKTCLTRNPVGQPCGPGVGGCAAGSGCNFSNVTHDQRLCYPDLTIGAQCNVFGVGNCPVGSSCEIEKYGSKTRICKPHAKLGGLCGAGVASCQPWLSCYFETVLVQKCFEFSKIGAPCGLNMGDCEPGSSCAPTSPANTSFVCVADEGIGEACGGPLQGLCDPDLAVCSALAPGAFQCMAKSTPAGDECGQFGIPPCVDGTNCIIDTFPNPVSASCYQDGKKGEPCGVGAGDCDKQSGAACFISNQTQLKGDCRPIQPLGSQCGTAIGDAGACGLLDAACTCFDPFIDPATCPAAENVCVGEVGLFDYCAVFSVAGSPYGTGWLGFCPAGAVCSLADSDDLTYLLFQCKLEAGLGQPCGLFHGCDEGECTCGGQDCTTAQLKAGDTGLCTP